LIKDEAATAKKDIKEREAQFHTLLEKICASFCVGIAALIGFLFVPILPAAVAVLLAITLGALTYKVPVLAIMVMFFGLILGYTYQLELPVLIVITLSITFIIISVSAKSPEYIIGVSCGVITAMLMITKFYFLALPLMVAIPLFRGRGRYLGSTGAIIIFLLMFVPFLVYGYQAQQPVTLFNSINFTTKPPLQLVDLNSIFTVLNKAIPDSTQQVTQFLDKLNIYFPIPLHSSPLGNRLLLFLLGGLLAASTAVAFGIIMLCRWLVRREVGEKILPWVSPTAAIIVAEAVFFVTFNSMTKPFSYQINQNTAFIAGSIGAAIILGVVGSLIEYWLSRRDLFVALSQTYLDLLPSVKTRLETVSEQTKITKSNCHTIDVITEDAFLRGVEQELLLASPETRHMGIDNLREKVSLFEDKEIKLDQTSIDIAGKLRRYYEDSRQRYRECVNSLSRFGYSFGETMNASNSVPLHSLDISTLIMEQRKLNSLYQTTATAALKNAEQLQNIIHTEIDGEWKSLGIEIGRNYFNQHNYNETLETLLPEFSRMDQSVSEATERLNEKFVSELIDLRNILTDSFIPTLEQIGDNTSKNMYAEVVSTLTALAPSSDRKIRLIDLGSWIAETHKLAEIINEIITDISRRLNAMEKDIENRSPIGFNWGKNLQTQEDVEVLVTSYNNGWSNVADRLNKIENAIKLIKAGIPLIIQYAHALEFMINYINIEYLIDEKLEQGRSVVALDIPVKMDYAQQYLRLYAENHHGQVFIEGGTGKLLKQGTV
jgi:hypothetical protein